MKFLLDTNVCIDYLSGRFPEVQSRLLAENPDDIAVSSIAIAELRYGADKSTRPTSNHRRIDELLEDLRPVAFDAHTALSYGSIRSDLENRGKLIGPNDMLIAAQAVANQLILVTDNTREFRRVAGLRLENWRA